MTPHVKPSWDEYFMGIMEAASKRASCSRGRSAAILVKDNRIVSTGYVGAPVGLEDCDSIGHLLLEVYDGHGGSKTHCVRTTHAEANAIAHAAKHGIATNGATMYCRMEPCRDCAKLLINAGIKRVVAQRRYQAADYTREAFSKVGITLDVLEDEVQKY
jgi:dCMP deaminase